MSVMADTSQRCEPVLNTKAKIVGKVWVLFSESLVVLCCAPMQSQNVSYFANAHCFILEGHGQTSRHSGIGWRMETRPRSARRCERIRLLSSLPAAAARRHDVSRGMQRTVLRPTEEEDAEEDAAQADEDVAPGEKQHLLQRPSPWSASWCPCSKSSITTPANVRMARWLRC